MIPIESTSTQTHSPIIFALLTDEELGAMLKVTTDWIRCHAQEIPGLQRLGMYYRFHRGHIQDWLGSLDPLLTVEEAAELLKVPASWVYANADQLPGALRLGRYVRFRPAVFHKFLAGSEACQ